MDSAGRKHSRMEELDIPKTVSWYLAIHNRTGLIQLSLPLEIIRRL